jgi:20S proteasome subunit beta 7
MVGWKFYQVSMIGVHFQDNHVATGFGNHLARPIFRDEWKEDMTLEEGVKLLEKCLLVLFYRDRSAINKFQVFYSSSSFIHAVYHYQFLPFAHHI